MIPPLGKTRWKIGILCHEREGRGTERPRSPTTFMSGNMPDSRLKKIVLLILGFCTISVATGGEPGTELLDNWHHWRGPEANGVAPKADLYAIRVFGCNGPTDVVIDAIDWALVRVLIWRIDGDPAVLNAVDILITNRKLIRNINRLERETMALREANERALQEEYARLRAKVYRGLMLVKKAR